MMTWIGFKIKLRLMQWRRIRNNVEKLILFLLVKSWAPKMNVFFRALARALIIFLCRPTCLCVWPCRVKYRAVSTAGTSSAPRGLSRRRPPAGTRHRQSLWTRRRTSWRSSWGSWSWSWHRPNYSWWRQSVASRLAAPSGLHTQWRTKTAHWWSMKWMSLWGLV